jgi:hypothetical protein
MFMLQKFKQQRFLKYLWLRYSITHTKIVRIGSDPIKKARIRPDPDPQHWYEERIVINCKEMLITASLLFMLGWLDHNVRLLVGILCIPEYLYT